MLLAVVISNKWCIFSHAGPCLFYASSIGAAGCTTTERKRVTGCHAKLITSENTLYSWQHSDRWGTKKNIGRVSASLYMVSKDDSLLGPLPSVSPHSPHAFHAVALLSRSSDGKRSEDLPNSIKFRIQLNLFAFALLAHHLFESFVTVVLVGHATRSRR